MLETPILIVIIVLVQTIRGGIVSCGRGDRRDLECCHPLLNHNGVVAFRASGARAAMTPRRFPPPSAIKELDACFVVRDRDGQEASRVE